MVVVVSSSGSRSSAVVLHRSLIIGSQSYCCGSDSNRHGSHRHSHVGRSRSGSNSSSSCCGSHRDSSYRNNINKHDWNVVVDIVIVVVIVTMVVAILVVIDVSNNIESTQLSYVVDIIIVVVVVSSSGSRSSAVVIHHSFNIHSQSYCCGRDINRHGRHSHSEKNTCRTTEDDEGQQHSLERDMELSASLEDILWDR